MAKRITKRRGRKSKHQGPKPYPEFPLTAHPSGRWCKKHNQRTYYFGPIDDPDAALASFQRQWSHIREHGEYLPDDPPLNTTEGGGCTMETLCNSFLNAKQDKLESGELSRASFSDYRHTTDRLISHFGRSQRVDQLGPLDFQTFRRKLASTLSPVTLKNQINRFRIVFKYAFEAELIDKPVRYGQAFDKPHPKTLKRYSREGGDKLFEAGEVRQILDTLDGKPVEVDGETLQFKPDPVMKAMVLLGVNAGFGNTDVSTLPQSAVDLDGGWIDFPRQKTEEDRRVPLWPETVKALRAALAVRPTPKNRADAGLCFVTVQGNRWVRITPVNNDRSDITGTKYTKTDTVTGRFSRILKKLRINGRRRLGFYSFRHTFATIGSRTLDRSAVKAIMGHSDTDMLDNYEHEVTDERLVAVTETVRRWLWPAE